MTCKEKNGPFVQQNLGTKNASSMSNLKAHAKLCWRDDIIQAIDKAGTAAATCLILTQKAQKDGSLLASFEHAGKGTITYSHKQHMKVETQYVLHIILL